MHILFYNPESMELWSIDDNLSDALDGRTTSDLQLFWRNPIMRKILLELTAAELKGEQLNTYTLQKKTGHSYSTVFNSIKSLEIRGFISKTLSYDGAKKMILTPKVFAFANTDEGTTEAMKLSMRKRFNVELKSTYPEMMIEILSMAKKEMITYDDVIKKTGLPPEIVSFIMEIVFDNTLYFYTGYKLSKEGEKELARMIKAAKSKPSSPPASR